MCIYPIMSQLIDGWTLTIPIRTEIAWLLLQVSATPPAQMRNRSSRGWNCHFRAGTCSCQPQETIFI